MSIKVPRIKKQIIKEYLEQECLGSTFESNCELYFVELAEKMVSRIERANSKPYILGINGSQGSGKSSLAKFLVLLFEKIHNLKATTVSLDDFYLTKRERQSLARDIHPLFETRGPPGTHDLEIALDFFDSLKNLSPGKKALVPRFDKSVDDRAPKETWPEIKGPLDIAIFEGWCLGAEPQQDFSQPLNQLESEEDPNLIWRESVNHSLCSYQALWAQLDYLVFLKAPSLETVINWRKLQEQKLREKSQGSGVMTENQVERFFAFYQRLTIHCLETIPNAADLQFVLKADHSISEALYQTKA